MQTDSDMTGVSSFYRKLTTRPGVARMQCHRSYNTSNANVLYNINLPVESLYLFKQTTSKLSGYLMTLVTK